MRLRDIMSEAVETVAAGATVAQAREQMRRQEVRHLVVMDRGSIAGVVSLHDLGRAPGAAKVSTVMSGEVVTATLQTTLRRAANLLVGHDVSCLPILEGGRLIGMVTVSDLLDLIGKGVTARQTDGARHRSFVPGR